jgi:hypothetical protein
VPAESFIDLSRFGSYAELDRFLKAVRPADAERYLAAGRAFLESETFRQRHTPEAFARQVLELV